MLEATERREPSQDSNSDQSGPKADVRPCPQVFLKSSGGALPQDGSMVRRGSFRTVFLGSLIAFLLEGCKGVGVHACMRMCVCVSLVKTEELSKIHASNP